MATNVIILNKYTLNNCMSSSDAYEIWRGRHRKSNERIRAIIFLSPLTPREKEDIKKWITLSSYRTSADKVVRYIDFFSSRLRGVEGAKDILIYPEISSMVRFGSLLKTNLNLYERIKYFHQLVRIFCSMHGTGTYHYGLNLETDSLLWDPKTSTIKVFKPPEEILEKKEKNIDEEYQNCGDILSKIFLDKRNEYETNKLQYMISILDAYQSRDSPQKIYNLLHDSFGEIKHHYDEIDVNTKRFSMVLLLAVFRNLNLKYSETTTSKLLNHLHEILALIPAESLNNANQQTYRVIAYLEGLRTPVMSSFFTSNVRLYHAILKDMYSHSNTETFIEYVEKNHNKRAKVNELVKRTLNNENALDPVLDVGMLEEYKRWYSERNKGGNIQEILKDTALQLREEVY